MIQKGSDAMIIRQFKPDQYEQLCKALAENAYPEPQSASYTVSLNVGTEEYRLRLQPESRRRVAALQALRIDRNENGPRFDLIVGGNLLFALLELWSSQNLRRS